MSIRLPLEKNVGIIQNLRGFTNRISFEHSVSIVHTDASIRQRRGGIGVCRRSSDTNFMTCDTFRASVHETKDINRIELGAIFAGIALTNIHDDLVIYSDSMNSIQNIVHKTKKSKYDKLAAFTLQLAKERTGNVFISKVKAHSGNIGNVYADELAKEGTNSSFEFILPDEFSSIDEWMKYNMNVCLLQ